jgi:hypothetical protein
VLLNLAKIIRLLITFYKNFFFFNSLITLACLILFREYGSPILGVLFWLKLSTLGLTYYFIRSYKSKEFYYYQNLGVSKTLLWTFTLGLDFCLFISLLILDYKL